MTDAEVIARVLAREGGYVNDPRDRGSATQFGITAATLGNWRGYNRPATADEVKALTQDEARQIYQARYIEQPGLTKANIPDDALRAAIIDEGVNAGPGIAIRHLQEALGITADGNFGPQTRAALKVHPSPAKLLVDVVRLRCVRYARIVQRDPIQVRFLAGWLDRAFQVLT